MMCYHDELWFVSGKQVWFNIREVINIINHIKRIKNTNNLPISINTEKSFDNIQHSIIIKKISTNCNGSKLLQLHKGYL